MANAPKATVLVWDKMDAQEHERRIMTVTGYTQDEHGHRAQVVFTDGSRREVPTEAVRISS